MNRSEIHKARLEEAEFQKAYEELFGETFEKAHKDGDTHPNGKWVWVSSANGGKGDWRTINGRAHKKMLAAGGGGNGGATGSGKTGGGENKVADKPAKTDKPKAKTKVVDRKTTKTEKRTNETSYDKELKDKMMAKIEENIARWTKRTEELYLRYFGGHSPIDHYKKPMSRSTISREANEYLKHNKISANVEIGYNIATITSKRKEVKFEGDEGSDFFNKLQYNKEEDDEDDTENWQFDNVDNIRSYKFVKCTPVINCKLPQKMNFYGETIRLGKDAGQPNYIMCDTLLLEDISPYDGLIEDIQCNKLKLEKPLSLKSKIRYVNLRVKSFEFSCSDPIENLEQFSLSKSEIIEEIDGKIEEVKIHVTDKNQQEATFIFSKKPELSHYPSELVDKKPERIDGWYRWTVRDNKATENNDLS